MPATAWDLFCSAWFSVISHWLTANSCFGHRSCLLLGWQCWVVLLCSARFIFSVGLSRASAFLWPAMLLALRYRVLYRHSGQHDAARVAKKDSVSAPEAHGAVYRKPFEERVMAQGCDSPARLDLREFLRGSSDASPDLPKIQQTLTFGIRHPRQVPLLQLLKSGQHFATSSCEYRASWEVQR